MPSPSRPQTVVALALLAATFAQAQQPLRTRANVGTVLTRFMVAPPTNVAVTGDDKAAPITWAGVANAVSYKVLRSTDPNVQGQDLTGPITAATFVDSKLAPGTTLYYSVVATAANGSTAASAPVAYLVPATMLAINKTAARRTFGVPAPQPAPAPPPTAPVIPAGTSVVPSAALPGQAVRVLGTGFSALTAVKSGTTSLTWTPVSDTEISLTLPGPVSGLYGRQSLPVALHHNAPNVAPGSVQPAPVVIHPPKIDYLSTHWAECCELVTLRGLGVSGSVTVGGVSVAVLAGNDYALTFRLPLLPTNDVGGPRSVEVRTISGLAVSPQPLTIVTGPSTITAIVPDVLQQDHTTQVVVHGTNLFRAVGICLPGATRPARRNDVSVRQSGPVPPSNDQMTVLIEGGDVRNPVAGPISLAVPAVVPTGGRSYRESSVCQANPTAVNITVQ